MWELAVYGGDTRPTTGKKEGRKRGGLSDYISHEVSEGRGPKEGLGTCGPGE